MASDQYSALGTACGNGDAEAVQKALDSGMITANETYPGPGFANQQIPALHIAVCSTSNASTNDVLEVVKILLSHPKGKCDVDIRDIPDQRTALYWAASLGNLDIVRILLEYGAKITPDALKIAEEKGHVGVVGELKLKM